MTEFKKSNKSLEIIKTNRITIIKNKKKVDGVNKKYYGYQAAISTDFLKIIYPSKEFLTTPSELLEQEYYIYENMTHGYTIDVRAPKNSPAARIKITKRGGASFSLPKRIIKELPAFDKYIKSAEELNITKIQAPTIIYVMTINFKEEPHYKLKFFLDMSIKNNLEKKIKTKYKRLPEWYIILKRSCGIRQIHAIGKEIPLKKL